MYNKNSTSKNASKEIIVMKSLFATLAIFLSSCGTAEPVMNHQFMPDNDLWKEDNVNLFSAVDQQTFNDIIQAGLSVYQPIAAANNEFISINARWDDATVNANCGRYTGYVSINMYGGLARRPEIIPEGFTLVMCHELGHAYAGSPYIQTANKMSAEGMSDYYSTKECYNKIAELVPQLRQEMTHTQYIKDTCEAKFGENSFNCKHALEGGWSLGKLLSTLNKEKEPSFETPDRTVVTSTQLSYPKTTQCRLDSYHNGALEMVKPACWFKN
jgi:hypothetical protein